MTDEKKKHFDWQFDKNPIIFTRTGVDALKDLVQQEIQNPAINFHDTADVKTVYEIMAEPHTIDIKPWQITTVDAIEEPTTKEELSKIHEELACMNKTINKVRHESTKKDETIDIQQKEITKLKSKLKKEKTKSKSNNNQMQTEIDDLQLEMNKVKNILDFKRYINGL